MTNLATFVTGRIFGRYNQIQSKYFASISCFKKGGYTQICLPNSHKHELASRTFSSVTSSGSYRLPILRPICINPVRQTRRNGIVQIRLKSSSSDKKEGLSPLMMAVYGSFALGGCLLLVIGYSYTERVKKRMTGIVRVSNREVKNGKKTLIKYKGYTLPNFMESSIPDIDDFKTNADDIWVVSYPRSGINELSMLSN